MERHSNTQVWEYFNYISDRYAECQTCKARISAEHKRTCNMKRHLLTKHGINTYLKETFKDKTSNKNDTNKGRWKYKKISDKDVEKACSNSICDDGSNENITTEEDEENNSTASSILPTKYSLEDVWGDVKNFQDDPLAKPNNLAISSVYSTTNARRNTSPTTTAIIENSALNTELAKLKTEALVAKLKAKARYFNELADLTHSKRVYIDLQCEQFKKS